jgi:hypothetical protein
MVATILAGYADGPALGRRVLASRKTLLRHDASSKTEDALDIAAEYRRFVRIGQI